MLPVIFISIIDCCDSLTVTMGQALYLHHL